MRVLIIEDEELILEFLTRSLKADRKEVDTAKSGSEGYRKASIHTYDAIVLDVMLPAKNGLDVCRQLRQDGNTTPIIVLSDNEPKSLCIESLDAGADDYLAKPFSHKELNARLRAVTRRPSAVLHSTLRVADVTLDATKHIVKRGDRELRLRLKEFALLECLMRNPGVVMERLELLKKVWGVSSLENCSNSLEASISSLRKKLSITGGKPLIYTVRGRGYKIISQHR